MFVMTLFLAGSRKQNVLQDAGTSPLTFEF